MGLRYRCEQCGKALTTAGGLEVHVSQWCPSASQATALPGIASAEGARSGPAGEPGSGYEAAGGMPGGWRRWTDGRLLGGIRRAGRGRYRVREPVPGQDNGWQRWEELHRAKSRLRSDPTDHDSQP